MKTLYRSIIALAAALAIVPALSAQPTANPEKYQLNDGVGYNKYLVDKLPNEDGEYTLRLETFVTGEVRKLSVPTDFVLVLDNSGSMLNDYWKTGEKIENFYAISNANALLIPDDGIIGTHYTFERGCNSGTVGQIVNYFNAGLVFNADASENDMDAWNAHPDDWNTPLAARFYKYDVSGDSANRGFYRIRQYVYKVKEDGVNKQYYNLRIRLKNGNYKYLNGTTLSNNPIKTVLKENYGDPPYSHFVNGAWQTYRAMDNKIIYSGGNIYRYHNTRVDELLKGVNSFINLVAADNRTGTWASGVTKNQIAIVAFGYASREGHEDDITVSTVKDWGTHVIQGFTEVNDDNADDMKALVPGRMNFRGHTATDQGIHLARLLLEDLQDGNDSMQPVDQNGDVKRNKVVIVFTDGDIARYQSIEHLIGDNNDEVPTITYYATAVNAMNEGNLIKAQRTDPSGTEINGKVYSIDFEGTYPEFLQHLSSDYSSASATLGEITSGDPPVPKETADNVIFTPTTTVAYHHYQSSATTSLEEVFTSIGQQNTGQSAGAQFAVVDKMSDSFVIPSNISGKVKFYTAQCIGTKVIDGDTYLAFAREVPAPDRGNLAYLWVASVNGAGHTTWVNKGNASGGTGELSDIDGTTSSPRITYSISDQNKTISIKGFRFTDLYCGLDEEHMTGATANTRHTVAADDPNYSNQVDGYRGFKLIVEFPIVLEEDAVGGPDVNTNKDDSGLYLADEDGNPVGDPVINYPEPKVAVPVSFIIQKDGLAAGESASFTLQRKLADPPSGTPPSYEDYVTFIITGDGVDDPDSLPEVRLLNLDPSYHYCVKETGWSWTYSIDESVYSTEDATGHVLLTNNPVVFHNTTPSTPTTVKHAEAKATNELKNDN